MSDRATVVARAKQHLGHREVTPNSSPLIDGWLRACGVPLGLPWCAAFASWCIDLKPPRSGALSLGRRFPETRNPQPGDLMWFATDDRGAGHIGIVVAGVGLDEVLCIEGNSANCIRYVRRLRSQVRFSSTSAEVLPLPALTMSTPAEVAAPLVQVTREGTR
jgi:hypothetical protein